MAALSVEALKREFDGSFALPVREIEKDTLDLLIIRVGSKPYALRVGEIGAVATGRRLTRVPSPKPALLGLIGVRGSLHAVFDLGALLGVGLASEAPRWVALGAGDEQLGLAFHTLEGHLRVPRTALEEAVAARQGFVEHLVRAEGELYPIVSVPRIAAAVSKGAGSE